MLKIGAFSQLAQVTVKTLRHYDQLGLLKPVWADRYTSYRYYELEQLARLHRILALKDLGLSLEEIKRLLDADVPVAELRGMLRLRQVELQEQLRQESERLTRVEARLAQPERSDGPASAMPTPAPGRPGCPVQGRTLRAPHPTLSPTAHSRR